MDPRKVSTYKSIPLGITIQPSPALSLSEWVQRDPEKHCYCSRSVQFFMDGEHCEGLFSYRHYFIRILNFSGCHMPYRCYIG